MENLKTSQQIIKINFLIVGSAFAILLALLLIQFSNIDVLIQNHLFDFEQKTWLVDRNEIVKKFIFYKLPKLVLGAAIIFSLIKIFTEKNRRKFLLIFLGLVLIPLIVGNIKKFTNVYCPSSLEMYGGNKPYVKIFDSYPQGFVQEKRGQCFPAGHAVTGFAFFILFFALEKKFSRFLGLTSALVLGSACGFYQMAKGVHFFGDTLISMLLCFLVAALLARISEINFSKND